jgi:hypothetical protein
MLGLTPNSAAFSLADGSRLSVGAAKEPVVPPGRAAAVSPSATHAPFPWTPFEWTGLDQGAQHFARAALHVPVKLKGVEGV